MRNFELKNVITTVRAPTLLKFLRNHLWRGKKVPTLSGKIRNIRLEGKIFPAVLSKTSYVAGRGIKGVKIVKEFFVIFPKVVVCS